MIRFVYKTTNNKNGKIYIGQHSTENLDDGYLGSGVVLQKAIIKYGKENFSREIITYVDTQEDLDRTEEIFIKHYIHIVGKDEMYNVAENAVGGAFFKDCHHSDKTRQKLSDALKGRHLPEEHKIKISKTLKGRQFSEETRQKMSESMKGIIRSNETRQKLSDALKGRQLPDEVKKKISESLKGRQISDKTCQKLSDALKGHPLLSKPVLCIDTGKIYPSLSEASRHTNIGISTISNVCRGIYKTAGGYHWKYIER